MAACLLGEKDRALLLDADRIIGVDEVGRGSLAGPVVVCAASFSSIPDDAGVRDSKRLSARRRDEAAERLRSSCERWAVCEVWVELIDRVNILEATRLAMRAAARALVTPGAVVVTDHVEPGDVGCAVLSPKRADADYFSVAAASILAKVHRDGIMVDLIELFKDLHPVAQALVATLFTWGVTALGASAVEKRESPHMFAMHHKALFSPCHSGPNHVGRAPVRPSAPFH